LFLGSVMLALGYQLFMAWVYSDNGQENTGDMGGEASAESLSD